MPKRVPIPLALLITFFLLSSAISHPVNALTPTFTPSFTPPPAPYVIANTTTPPNIYVGPDTAYQPPIGTLAIGERAPVTGRNANLTWVQIRTITGHIGWIDMRSVSLYGDPARIPVIPVSAPTQMPTIPPISPLDGTTLLVLEPDTLPGMLLEGDISLSRNVMLERLAIADTRVLNIVADPYHPQLTVVLAQAAPPRIKRLITEPGCLEIIDLGMIDFDMRANLLGREVMTSLASRDIGQRVGQALFTGAFSAATFATAVPASIYRAEAFFNPYTGQPFETLFSQRLSQEAVTVWNSNGQWRVELRRIYFNSERLVGGFAGIVLDGRLIAAPFIEAPTNTLTLHDLREEDAFVLAMMAQTGSLPVPWRIIDETSEPRVTPTYTPIWPTYAPASPTYPPPLASWTPTWTPSPTLPPITLPPASRTAPATWTPSPTYTPTPAASHTALPTWTPESAEVGTSIPQDILIRSFYRPSTETGSYNRTQLEQTAAVLATRLETLEVSGAQVTLTANNDIVVEMPLAASTELVLETLNQPGLIQFIQIDARTGPSYRLSLIGDQINPGDFIIPFSGDIFASAEVAPGIGDGGEVNFTLEPETAGLYDAFIEVHPQDYFGIVVDDVIWTVISAASQTIPTVNEMEAHRLAAFMASGPLPLPLEHYNNAFAPLPTLPPPVTPTAAPT